MRDISPFAAVKFINRIFRAIVFGNQARVELVEPLCLNGSAVLDCRMREIFKFCKERLAIDCPTDIFELIDEKIDLFGI